MITKMTVGKICILSFKNGLFITNKFPWQRRVEVQENLQRIQNEKNIIKLHNYKMETYKLVKKVLLFMFLTKVG